MWRGSPLANSLMLIALLPSTSIAALEFRSVSTPTAILYDAPSASAKKVFVVGQYYPLEIIVNLGDWLKVRDAQGGVNWIESRQLESKRMVIVRAANAEIRETANVSATLLATVEKDVVLEVVDPKLNGGWLKVKHRDGLSGFVQANAVWGLN